MTLAELIKSLKNAGVDAKYWQITHARRAGLIKPVPINESGMCDYGLAHFFELKEYLTKRRAVREKNLSPEKKHASVGP